ncbi:hypothetical protein ACQFX9_20105 [Aliinostoc sp. HNIBRCY26]|uniref:hypothetical protein n=1 Tax=Aliinostoc sp. HNIBRCY26 TaxID=3418997 RepID=UPI003CFC626B
MLLNQAENLAIKILKTLLRTISFGLIFLSLVSCGNGQTSPTGIERPTINSNSSPAPTDSTTDKEDEDDEQDEADQDDKDKKN